MPDSVLNENLIDLKKKKAQRQKLQGGRISSFYSLSSPFISLKQEKA